ncbi:hypothetical protein [Mycolicibacterium austroafricanum]|uniref:hypothetical protein n=1 Tax=Mycolicibacterium austroafricanum TaxID=39687 RepID=UPI001F25BDCF|nr:hypothetical protein [Mycolicibacterium austroafricanum]
MDAPREPVIIAEQGGLVVAERGAEVLVFDRGNGPSEITLFVLVVITLVFGGFGVISVFSDFSSGTTPLSGVIGTLILAVGVIAAVAMYFCAKGIRSRKRRPLTAFTPVAVFDRAQRIYRDGAGEVVAPLDQVRFERRLQLTSSSPKLVAVSPCGDRVLKRGNPFGGGIGDLDQVLNAVVHSYRG